MQRLFRRRLSVCGLYDADYSTSGNLSAIGPESKKLDCQTCVDLEFPRHLS